VKPVKHYPKVKKLTWKEVKRQKFLLLGALFFVIYGVVFYYLPLSGWAIAFQDFRVQNGLFGSDFIFLDKFKFLFSQEQFINAIRNTLAMGVINLVTATAMAIIFAILLNEVRSKGGKKIVQTLSYLPHFLSWIIVTAIIRDALSNSGIVNELFMNIGILDSPINFFEKKEYFWGIVSFSNLWKETGWNAIIYLAAIASIDQNLYEASAIDGAGRWAKIRHVTLPSIQPTIMILLLINIGNVLNTGFEIQYLLENDTIQSVSKTIEIYVLDWGIGENDYALGTAAGIFKSIVSIILVVGANYMAKRSGNEKLF
jgi:putative aldouronate transport system permease protein